MSLIRNNPLVQFVLVLIVGLGMTAGLHLLALHLLVFPLWENHFGMAYMVNGNLALVIYIILFLLRKTQEQSLGYIFMAGSLLKFGVFFLLFQPLYKEDGDMSRMEFLTFFVPYMACLILETFFLIKLLNKNN